MNEILTDFKIFQQKSKIMRNDHSWVATLLLSGSWFLRQQKNMIIAATIATKTMLPITMPAIAPPLNPPPQSHQSYYALDSFFNNA